MGWQSVGGWGGAGGGTEARAGARGGVAPGCDACGLPIQGCCPRTLRSWCQAALSRLDKAT